MKLVMVAYTSDIVTEPRGVPPSRWGSSAWTFIHYVALGYPRKPTPRDIDDYAAFFTSLPYILPCKACRDHMQDHLVDMPIGDALAAGRDAIFEWTVQLHNAVNVSLGLPAQHFQAMVRHYTRRHISARPKRVRVYDAVFGACIGAACVVILALLASSFLGRSRRAIRK
jgi:hypothetical protein